MRSLLGQFNVYRWAGKMLVDAARVRNQERVTGRLTPGPRRIRRSKSGTCYPGIPVLFWRGWPRSEPSACSILMEPCPHRRAAG